MKRTRKADVTVIDSGSIVLFAPLTPKARAWCDEHLPEDCPRMGVNYAVERRYAGDIVTGMQEAGLVFSQPTRH